MQFIRRFSSIPILTRKFPGQIRLASSAVEDIHNVEKLEEDLFGREMKSGGEKEPRKKGFKTMKKKPLEKSSEKSTNNEIKIDENTNLTYRDLKLKDPILRDTMMLFNSSRTQKKNALMVLEGRRLIKDALKSNLTLRKLFFCRREDLKELADLLKNTEKSELYRTAYRDLTLWSQLSTSPGLLAVFDRPNNLQCKTENCLPISVICDNIREPNNLGSVIRICAALPCREVFVMKGCTDPFDAKCLRGGAGGQFHIPVKYPIEWESLPEHLPEENSVFVAESRKDNNSIDVAEYSLPPDHIKDHHMTVIIGGEIHGISEQGYKLMKLYKDSASLHIPLASCVESLNTASALAVILFELRRKFQQNLENFVNSSDEE
ncbi:rRNA methyltransferase 3, mitochondrial [Sergentomyia squamirostris]